MFWPLDYPRLSQHKFRPQDAFVDEILTIQARTQGEPEPQTVGHLVRYNRFFEGLPILSMGEADHISILVGAEQVEAVSSLWTTIQRATYTATRQNQTLLSAPTVLMLNHQRILQSIKGPQQVQITGVETVYGINRNQEPYRLVPAYAFTTDQGLDIVIDAQTGQLLY